MTRLFSLPFLVCAALTACSDAGTPREAGIEPEETQMASDYLVDPETGEVRASHTDAAGVTTTLRAGEKVDPVLPQPFVLPPGAAITRVTRVDQGDAMLVTIAFTTELTVAELAARYRDLGAGGGFALTTDIAAADNAVLAGRHQDGAGTFSLSARRSAQGTAAELTVARSIG